MLVSGIAGAVLTPEAIPDGVGPRVPGDDPGVVGVGVVATGVAVGMAVGAGVGVGAAAKAQPAGGGVMTFESSVSAPFMASARPPSPGPPTPIVAPVFMVMLVIAMIVP